MKAILVIDMPDGVNVNDVIIGGNGNIYFMGEGWKTSIVGNIKKIKPMPEKLDYASDWEDVEISFRQGWNACLEELEK